MESIRRKTVEEWGEVLSDWRRSGESQRGYCRSKGIAFSSFTYWKRKLEVVGEECLMVRVGSLAQAPSLVDRTAVTVRAGGVEVELRGQISEELVGRIVRALKGVS